MPTDSAHQNLSADQMAAGCPVPHAAMSSGGSCPVPHGQAAMLLAQKKAQEIAAKKEEGLIHKLYDGK